MDKPDNVPYLGKTMTEGLRRVREADAGAVPGLTEYQKAAPIIRDLWQDLMEKDDRNSPAEYPEMCLITFEEFARYMEAAIAAHKL